MCVVFGFLVLVAVCFVCFRRRMGGKIIFRQTTSTRRSFIKTNSALSLDHSKYSTDADIESNSNPYLKPPHIFTYRELDEATDGFHSDREIGDGGFGTVYKGFLRDGRTVAVKRLYENNHKRLEQFLNEVKIVEPLRHPNLVTLYGCTSHHSRELLLVYEFVCNGTIADHLHGPRASERALTWPLRIQTAIEAADALAHLHAIEPPIIHRDVKTNNILLDNSFHVKVADFGLSRLFPLDATHVSTAPQGTPGYVDPEYYNCYQLTDKSDVYSMGVVLVELISSKPAVDITRRRQDINLSKMAISKIPKGLVHELADPELGYETDPEVKRQIHAVAEVAFLCLQSDKDMRPPMKEVKTMLFDILNAHNGNGPPLDGEKKNSGLLKLEGPVSPDTVTSKWYSRVTTPNSSV